MARPDEVRELLVAARRTVGQEQVALRVDTDLLETVYLEVEYGALVIHDRGETFSYLRDIDREELLLGRLVVATAIVAKVMPARIETS
jgi:hypothetical protein